MKMSTKTLPKKPPRSNKSIQGFASVQNSLSNSGKQFCLVIYSGKNNMQPSLSFTFVPIGGDEIVCGLVQSTSRSDCLSILEDCGQ